MHTANDSVIPNRKIILQLSQEEGDEDVGRINEETSPDNPGIRASTEESVQTPSTAMATATVVVAAEAAAAARET